MASQMRSALMVCVLLLILMEDAFADKCRRCKLDFEDGLKGWVQTGTAFKNQPTYGDNPTARHRGQPSEHQGNYWIGGYENRPTPASKAGEIQGDEPRGTLTSPVFRIRGRYISFLIGGGCDHHMVRAELVINDEVVKTATGRCTETMTTKSWDVAYYNGERAQVRLVDNGSGSWHHINFDDLRGDIRC